MALRTIPLPALVSVLLCHLQEVRDNPTETLNEKLLEQFDSQSSSMWRLPSRPGIPVLESCFLDGLGFGIRVC